MTVAIEKIKIPINPENQYELLDVVQDDRFKRVKIWIAHSGENANHSVFEKETLVKMIDTLSAVPIVGYVESNKDDEDDFSDHRQKIILKNNDIEVEYMCHAYGFIPSDNNAQIAYRGGKEWLVAEGYLWTKFEKALEIFDNANGTKSHSMEIDNVQGFVDEEGRLNVTDARFSALCILGDHVNPGMTGSTIEYFNHNIIQEEIKQMMLEFSQKGDDSLNPKEEMETETVVEETIDETIDSEEQNDAESEIDGTQESFEVTEETQENIDENDSEAEPEETQDEKFELVYSLSHEDIRSKLYSKIRESSDEWAWIIETYDDEFIYAVEAYENDKWTNKYFRSKYTKTNDEIQLGEKTEVFTEFLTLEELSKLKNDRARIDQLEQELTELKMSKQEAESKLKQDLIESYSERLDEEERKELINSVAKFSSTADLEKEIAYLIFKKQEESPRSGTAAVNFQRGEKDGRYGDLDRFFVKTKEK